MRPSGYPHIPDRSAPEFGVPLAEGSESLTGRVAKHRNLCTWRRENGSLVIGYSDDWASLVPNQTSNTKHVIRGDSVKNIDGTASRFA